jgi:hypothetical protein
MASLGGEAKLPAMITAPWPLCSPAAWLRHKSSNDGFKQPLFVITGLQAGARLGRLWWGLTG